MHVCTHVSLEPKQWCNDYLETIHFGNHIFVTHFWGVSYAFCTQARGKKLSGQRMTGHMKTSLFFHCHHNYIHRMAHPTSVLLTFDMQHKYHFTPFLVISVTKGHVE